MSAMALTKKIILNGADKPNKNMTTEQRQQRVTELERQISELQGEVGSGQFDKLPAYAIALAHKRAAELGVDLPELEHCETFTPQDAQDQVDQAHVQFLEAHVKELKRAMQVACYYISQGAPGRATEVLNQALTI